MSGTRCTLSRHNTKRSSKNLEDALELFLVSCFDRGTLDQVLKECGFRPHFPSDHREVSRFDKTIDVPIQNTLLGNMIL